MTIANHLEAVGPVFTLSVVVDVSINCILKRTLLDVLKLIVKIQH